MSWLRERVVPCEPALFHSHTGSERHVRKPRTKLSQMRRIPRLTLIGVGHGNPT